MIKNFTLPQEIKILLGIIILQCLLWSAYLVWFKPLLLSNVSSEAIVRSIVRVSIVGIPALLYIHYYKKEKIADYFSTKNLQLDLKLGFLTSLFILLFFLPRLHNFQFPLDFPAWMNWIIGSPLVEELYFRGIILKELAKHYSKTSSILFSSLLFTALHMPQWIFHHNLDLISILVIFVYGVGFALLWMKTKSIFTALLPHCFNNFLNMATGFIR